MKDLNGRVAVVTGGASGIGRGMVEAFLAEGMKVVIGDVEKKALDATVAELSSAGSEVTGAVCDVSKPESVDALAKATLDAFGAVHVLCNNAGVGVTGAGRSWERPIEDWHWVMGVNLNGVMHGIRSFVPIMLEQGEDAHVVNTASIAGLVPGGGSYGVSKSACVALSESLFSELAMANSKIGVSALCPGWVRTRILESDRNRPEAPREIPVEEATPLVEMMRKAAEGAIEKGLDPREVGNIVVDAIKTRRFYILTHPWQNMIEHHAQNILQGRDPVGVMPPGLGLPE